MIHLNAMPLDFEPRRKILPKLSEHVSNPQNLIAMTEFESAFLCGALKQFRPKKILEVGVLDGGSTSVILQALEDFGAPYEMHSVDIASERPFAKGVETGFVAKFVKENNLLAPPRQPYAVNTSFISENFCRRFSTKSATKLTS